MPNPSPPAERHGHRGAWLVWGLGVLGYVVAVFQRGSLGVAALQAQHRLGASAGDLSLFVVLQLAVYAAAQIPVGVALDRFGTRRMVVTGGVVMALGQAALAVAHSVGLAVLARVLVGAGDAMTFISVLRLVAHWFAPRQAPLVTQLTALLGQLGQIVAAYPLVTLLHAAGWEPTFLGAAGVGVAVSAACLAGLRDTPAGAPVPPQRVGMVEVVARVRDSWSRPATRLGFWSHFVTQFSGNTFALLWGYPFLVGAEGLSPAVGGSLLSVQVVVSMGVGPTLGRLTAGWPRRRSVLVRAVVAVTALTWTALLLLPGRAPLALLVWLVVVLGTNGPGSMVGIDFARTHNPVDRIGTASGIVNMGGFIAALVTVALMGIVLGGSATHTAVFSVGAFRGAFAVQWPLWVLGLVMVARSRGQLLRADAAAGITAVDPLHRAVARRWQRNR
jgi:predicted MFS family arabinose efflux permease